MSHVCLLGAPTPGWRAGRFSATKGAWLAAAGRRGQAGALHGMSRVDNRARPAWPRELDPDFPFDLDVIVRRMLARDPDARCDCDEVARIMRAHT